MLRFLRSMPLAVGLIAYLAGTGLLATLVPQGKAVDFYFSRYPRLLAEILVQSGFSRFFSSLLFILPAFAFFMNLSACSVHRFIGQVRTKGRRRHGPDILHFGLMLLVIGAVLSFSGRKEGFVELAPGDAAELPDGSLLRLTDFRYLTYEDGRPRAWISSVVVEREGTNEGSAFDIRVNHPLKTGGLTIYQVTHSREFIARISVGERQQRLTQGEALSLEGAELLFVSADDGAGKAVFRLKGAEGSSSLHHLGAGERVGPFLLSSLEELDITGLQAVVDPGYGLVLAALLLAGIGLFLTFIQKLGDLND